ncbi:DUF3427 domain-containing protein, partial [Francisella tularensis subsp. holarctica]|uniref:DUF3427 domain-containing protein n=1 Tax=Francisella tularensis TaxID=263 RepID=UPI002381D1A2
KKFGLYDNKFISQQAFSYYSRAAKTLDDPLEKALVENSYHSYVFARINKHDSYFFLGLVSKCLEDKEINASKKLVSYIFELEKP